MTPYSDPSPHCSELTPGPDKLQKSHRGGTASARSPQSEFGGLQRLGKSWPRGSLSKESCGLPDPSALAGGHVVPASSLWLSHRLVAQQSGMWTVPPQSGKGAAEGPVSLSNPVVLTAARTGLSLMAGAGRGSDCSPSIERPPLEALGRPRGLQHPRPLDTERQGRACPSQRKNTR